MASHRRAGRHPRPRLSRNVAQIAHELTPLAGDDVGLLVTSNGILKFFLKLVPGAFDEMAAKGALKVGTGNCCALAFEAGAWRVVFWNRQPASLAFERSLLILLDYVRSVLRQFCTSCSQKAGEACRSKHRLSVMTAVASRSCVRQTLPNRRWPSPVLLRA